MSHGLRNAFVASSVKPSAKMFGAVQERIITGDILGIWAERRDRRAHGGGVAGVVEAGAVVEKDAVEGFDRTIRDVIARSRPASSKRSSISQGAVMTVGPPSNVKPWSR